ncbi:hypothetical protein PCL_05312 [Purpureocillium lilacinum]|uniref:Uncharacterized protein n=1 Tax=Purpureocillium lilacinum TaxID=33203 RepID=A0A2U3DV46_PURLI|nr:hypothetical protein PCL_05312 [Purpureocillium lilacinum]
MLTIGKTDERWRGIPLNPPCPSLQGRTAPRAAPLAGTPCTFSPSAVCWSGTSLRGGGRAEGCLLQVQTTWNLQPLAQGHSRPRLGPCRAWLKSALAALAPILPSCVTIVYYYYYYYLAVRRTNPERSVRNQRVCDADLRDDKLGRDGSPAASQQRPRSALRRYPASPLQSLFSNLFAHRACWGPEGHHHPSRKDPLAALRCPASRGPSSCHNPDRAQRHKQPWPADTQTRIKHLQRLQLRLLGRMTEGQGGKKRHQAQVQTRARSQASAPDNGVSWFGPCPPLMQGDHGGVAGGGGLVEIGSACIDVRNKRVGRACSRRGMHPTGRERPSDDRNTKGVLRYTALGEGSLSDGQLDRWPEADNKNSNNSAHSRKYATPPPLLFIMIIDSGASRTRSCIDYWWRSAVLRYKRRHDAKKKAAHPEPIMRWGLRGFVADSPSPSADQTKDAVPPRNASRSSRPPSLERVDGKTLGVEA